MMGANLTNLALWTSDAQHFETSDSQLTGSGFSESADRFANLLLDGGVLAGTNVMVSMHNRIATLIVSLAIWRIGAVVVPVPPTNRRSLLDWPELTNRAVGVRSEHIVVGNEAEYDFAVAAGHIVFLDDRRSGARTCPLEGSSRNLAVIQFSSGSTGAPKPIELSHSNIISNAIALNERAGMDDRTITYSWLPLHHDMGLMGGFVATAAAGGKLVLGEPRAFTLDPVGWLRELSRTGASVTGGPPFAYKLMIERLRRHDRERLNLDLSAVRTAFIGAERIEPQLYETVESALRPFGWRAGALYAAYGQAENTVATTAGTPLRRPRLGELLGDRVRSIDWAQLHTAISPIISCGRPVDGTRVEVLDGDGAAVEEGFVGRLRISGSSFGGSGDLEDRDSGDTGAMLDGELYVVGRQRELIKVAGRAFAPQELEAFLADRVPDSYAVGVSSTPDAESHTEKIVVAVEYLQLDAILDRDEFARSINGLLVEHYGLRAAHVLRLRAGSVPRTSSGKLRRSEIPKLIAKGPE